MKLKVFRDGWFEADSLHMIAAVDDGYRQDVRHVGFCTKIPKSQAAHLHDIYLQVSSSRFLKREKYLQTYT